MVCNLVLKWKSTLTPIITVLFHEPWQMLESGVLDIFETHTASLEKPFNANTFQLGE